MYITRPTARFQRDLKQIKKRGYAVSLLTAIIKMRQQENCCQRKTGITGL